MHLLAHKRARLRRTAVLLALALAVAGCSGTETETVSDDPPPLVDPPVITSEGGLLQTTLTAAPGTVTFNGTEYPTNLYNDLYIPPVLRLNPGDTVDLTLENGMPAADGNGTHSAAGHDSAQSFTNLHYHGFNVSPQPPADDIFLEVYPEGSGLSPTSYNYDFALEENHPIGMFWYHPHPHGQSEGQVLGGMSGGIIVGDFMKTYYPDLPPARERIMLLKDFQTDPSGQAPLLKTINGLPSSSFQIAPGELQLWRFANIAADAFFDMQLQDSNGQAVPLWVVAVDGNAVPQPTSSEHLFLGPGARMEVLVVGPPEGTYQLKSLKIDTGPAGDPNPEVTLSEVTSEGEPPQTITSEDLAAARPGRPVPNLPPAPAGVTQRQIVFSESANGNTFLINGQEWARDRIDTEVQLGAVEVWTVLNASTELHVFHIHQIDFAVLEINGVPQDSGGLQDTITVPYQPPDGPPGSVTLLMNFGAPYLPGEFVYHCHILGHEDNGMMANIEVVAGT